MEIWPKHVKWPGAWSRRARRSYQNKFTIHPPTGGSKFYKQRFGLCTARN
ncbi:hypothetical protein GCM10027428_27390 [Haliea atlantica]